MVLKKLMNGSKENFVFVIFNFSRNPIKHKKLPTSICREYQKHKSLKNNKSAEHQNSPSQYAKQKDTNNVPCTEQSKHGTAYHNISKKSQKPPHSRKILKTDIQTLNQ